MKLADLFIAPHGRERRGQVFSELGLKLSSAQSAAEAARVIAGCADLIVATEGRGFWIVDALRHKPHPSHLNLDEALAGISPEDRAKAQQAARIWLGNR